MPANQRVTNEQVISAYKETGSIWRAAERLGICGQSLHERLVRMGYKMVRRDWSAEEREVAAHLCQNGVSICRIAERLGRTYAATACELSAMKIKSAIGRPIKAPRGVGLNKRRVTRIARAMLHAGETVNKTAKRERVTTTGLVSAMQVLAPTEWNIYLLRRGAKPLVCAGCGNEFRPLGVRQKYCTNRCGNHARADAKYFGGKRRNAIGLAEGVCQLCEKKGKTLSVHHVFGKENDPENEVLIALCMGCHQLVGILGRRADCLEPSFWENMISLAAARKLADQGVKPEVMEVCVQIEQASFSDFVN